MSAYPNLFSSNTTHLPTLRDRSLCDVVDSMASNAHALPATEYDAGCYLYSASAEWESDWGVLDKGTVTDDAATRQLFQQQHCFVFLFPTYLPPWASSQLWSQWPPHGRWRKGGKGRSTVSRGKGKIGSKIWNHYACLPVVSEVSSLV